VVAVAKRARVLSEQNKNDENNRLSTMVTEALDEITKGKVTLKLMPDATSKEA
jgi:DNA-directed RNA polymerase subunit omega